jgi:hypothetical protein
VSSRPPGQLHILYRVVCVVTYNMSTGTSETLFCLLVRLPAVYASVSTYFGLYYLVLSQQPTLSSSLLCTLPRQIEDY